MTTVKEIIDAIYDFAPLSLQESYDNCGLQTGDPNMASTGVLLAVDMTEELLDEAIGLGFNTILTHHPLIFRGIANVTPSHTAGRIVMKAVKHDIAIISAPTNIDKAYRGVSYRMGSKLGLRAMRPCGSERRLRHRIGGNRPIARSDCYRRVFTYGKRGVRMRMSAAYGSVTRKS